MDIEKAKKELLNIHNIMTLKHHIAGPEAIRLVLSELEKKNNMYIKEYNEHMEKKRQNGVLINNERILKMELEKKDKVINEMAKTLTKTRETSEEDCFIPKTYRDINDCIKTSCEECIKEYFEKEINK